jgi:hypothetical protein
MGWASSRLSSAGVRKAADDGGRARSTVGSAWAALGPESGDGEAAATGFATGDGDGAAAGFATGEGDAAALGDETTAAGFAGAVVGGAGVEVEVEVDGAAVVQPLPKATASTSNQRPTS